MVDDEIPEEDRYLEWKPDQPPKIRDDHEHDYIDLYCGWGPAKDDPQSRLVWVMCRKCLAKRQLRLNMHNVVHEEDE